MLEASGGRKKNLKEKQEHIMQDIQNANIQTFVEE